MTRLLSSFAFAALLVSLAFASVRADTGTERVGDFALIDQDGKFHQLSRYGYQKAVVLISQANGCELIPDSLPRLDKIRQDWQDQDVTFLMINSSGRDGREAIRREADAYDIDFPILQDQTQLVAESLGVGTVGQVLIIDPRTMKLVFLGPLDERKRRSSDADLPSPLTDALQRTVAGEVETVDTVVVDRAPGGKASACNYDFPEQYQHASVPPDYATDIAPILQENCVHCHRQGGIGPFAMDGYQMVRGFSPMIKEVLLTKRMPPAQVDPTIGHFSNARYISDKESQTLVHWIDQGAPRGDGDDPLLANKLAEDVMELEPNWPLGPPDYIVNVPTQQIPATGVIDYINVAIELPFDEDKWIRAVHFRPGDTKVMHHLLSYVVPGDYERGSRSTMPRSERRFLEGYAPGKADSIVYPANAGVYIPKGHKLTMQLHYTSYGKATEDSTQLGLYFHTEKPEFEFHNKSVSQGNFRIPPGAPEHRASQQYVFEKGILLYGLRPHMHYRGKHFQFKVIYPDQSTEVLLSVPNYNFAWQPTYRLEEPIALPAGSRVVVSGAFDNSAFNPGNPDPSKEITWGDQSWDEMFIGYFAYHFLDPEEVRTD